MMVIIDEATTLVAADGTLLAASLVRPEIAPRAAVVVASATAVPQPYYRPFARFLAARGFAVTTFDYRGLFGSKPADWSRFRGRMRDWGEQDVAAALAWTKARFPDVPLLAVTHSVGGQVLPLAPNRHLVDAMFMVCSQGGYYRAWPTAASVVGMWTVWNALVPTLVTSFGYWPGALGIGANLPAGIALEWASWCRSPDYLFVEEGAARRAAFAAMRVPVHAESFTDDSYATETAVRWLLDAYRGASVTHRHRHPSRLGARSIGHFGFFRPRFQDTLWEEAAEWLEARLADRPLDDGAQRDGQRGDRRLVGERGHVQERA